MLASSLSRAASLLVAVLVALPTAVQGEITPVGCFPQPEEDIFQLFGTAQFMSSGYCRDNCTELEQPVMATTSGSTCYCGNTVPPRDTQVDMSNCNTACAGYDLETCGGLGYFQVALTGYPETPIFMPNSSTSTSTSSGPTSGTSAPPQATLVVTAEPTPGVEPSSSGPNRVGIAVGVVVGVIALAAAVGGFVLFRKRRQNQEIEEEHRRNAAVGAFVGSSDKATMDSRLDPSFTTRRTSIGSIADERDFTRRILQVRNPDRDSKASAA